MKKKVLHLLRTNSFSGAENVVISIVENTQNDFNGIYVSPPGPIENILQKNGVSFSPIKKLSPKNLLKVIKKEKPDIIHAHDFTAGLVAAVTPTKIPIINHLHNNSPWLTSINIKSIIYGLSIFRYKKVLTVSESVEKEYIFKSLFGNKVVVIGNPINTKALESIPIEERKYDFVFLGRLAEQKNPFLFIDIISTLKEERNDISAIMIGDGPLREMLQEKINKENLTFNIKLLGFQDNPYQYLKVSKILIMPSKWEGFGLAAVEALAFGLPVLASNVGGLPTIVDDTCGKLCDTKNNYTDLATELLSNQEKLKSMSFFARKKAKQLNNIESYSYTIKEIYKNIY